MKKKLRRLLAAALCLAVLACGAYALSSGDSLISLNYLTQTFLPKAVSQGETAANQKLQETYDAAKSQLDQVQQELVSQATGSSGALYSADLRPRDWSEGQTVSLPTGAGFLLTEGSAQVTHGGAVVDVTQGSTVASGTRLTAGHRYVVGEDTTAQVTVLSGAARLGLQGSYTAAAGMENPLPFYDVSQTDWYYEPVRYVYENGVFSGMSEHTFGAGEAMNRAMLMTVLYQMAGAPEAELNAADAAFSDVPDSAWYASYVRWGASQGITAGTGPNTFGPGLQVTREQVVVLLYSFGSDYLGLDLSRRADLSGYQDLEQSNVWARAALSWAVADGIISSSSTDALTISPQRSANRAEVAAMLRGFAEKFL